MLLLRDRLKVLRERLLDLTFKNRLLNHSDLGRRVLKVRRLALGEVYRLLVEQGKELTVAAAPNSPSSSGNPEGKPAVNGIPHEPFEDSGADLADWLRRWKLPVALPPLMLDNRLRTMHSQYREVIEATGSNFLYLALGFLEWRDPDREPDKARLAPLVLVPIEIERRLERTVENEPEESDSGNGKELPCGTKQYH
jgi:hypothetical protein